MNDKPTAAQRVLAMRDDFLILVDAYNKIWRYDHALDAQAMVIALDKFEDEHNITDVAWPPQPDPEYTDCFLEITHE